jgi:hypothetical protein
LEKLKVGKPEDQAAGAQVWERNRTERPERRRLGREYLVPWVSCGRWTLALLMVLTATLLLDVLSQWLREWHSVSTGVLLLTCVNHRWQRLRWDQRIEVFINNADALSPKVLRYSPTT